MKASLYTRIPHIVCLLGAVYSIYLLCHVQEGVYYSGDAGVKALLVEQYSRGNFGVALDLPAEQWVKRIWDKGLYPFGPPFVYDMPRGRVVAFPFLFSLICTPVFRLFGAAGLYVVPVVSLWLLWAGFVVVARRIGLSLPTVSISLAVLVFSSPLTLYGAMFWEHTLGALLVFCGAGFVITVQHKQYTKPGAFAWGVIAGLSVWIRSESLCAVVAFAGLGVYLLVWKHYRSLLFFLLGLAVSACLLWVVNTILYGHPLGVHSFQVLDRAFFLPAPQDPLNLMFSLFLYLPILFFIVPSLMGRYDAGRRRIPAEASCLLVVCIVCLLAIPIVVPNTGGKQWGPRYLLIVVPPLCLLAGMLLEMIRKVGNHRTRRCLIAVFGITAALGAYMNSYVGTKNLLRDYEERVKPALQIIRQSGNQCVAVRHQWIAQELAVVCKQRAVFAIRGEQDLAVLVTALTDKGYSGFLFVTYPGDRLPEEAGEHVGDSPAVDLRWALVGRHGDYELHDVELVPIRGAGSRG